MCRCAMLAVRHLIGFYFSLNQANLQARRGYFPWRFRILGSGGTEALPGYRASLASCVYEYANGVATGFCDGQRGRAIKQSLAY